LKIKEKNQIAVGENMGLVIGIPLFKRETHIWWNKIRVK